jgi:hypothetical protein
MRWKALDCALDQRLLELLGATDPAVTAPLQRWIKKKFVSNRFLFNGNFVLAYRTNLKQPKGELNGTHARNL